MKVKGDMEIKVPESVLGLKEWQCKVISNKNVATFIKEFKVQLPPGEHMSFIPGSYAQIKIPKYDINYNDFDRDLINNAEEGKVFVPAWEKFGLFNLHQKNDTETIRAYSMANYPDEGDTYLKAHEAPEDIEYYLCGPPMMAKTVIDLLDSLGVEQNMIHFDNFGG